MPSDSSASLPLVVLSGRPYEVGRQYGSLMREELAHAVSIEDVSIRPMLEKLGVTEQAMRERMAALAALLPEDIHEEVRGVSDASGFPRETILYHTLVLDILSGAPIGCSQFAAFGRATTDGKVLHGHNLDVPYPSLAKFLRPTCVVYRLEGRIPYVSVTFWPAALGVCSGMNAAGLSLGVNVPVAPLDPRVFYPLTFQNREVLSRARTLDEACAVLEATPRGGSWNLMLTHRSGQAMVWEQVGAHSGQYTAHPEQDFIVSTNHLRVAHKAARGHEAVALEMLQDMQEDSLHRYRRLEHLVRERQGDLTLDTAVDFLRDSEGVTPSMKSICRADNALSMAYEPETLTLDFAAGAIPAALAPRRRLQLGPLFQGAMRETPEQGAFPMRGAAREPGCWTRTFALHEDVYLEEHRVNGIPVLPGAAAIEWLAEVASVAGEGDVREVRDVSLEKFIRVRPERPTEACVRAVRRDDIWEVSAYADLLNPRGAVLRSDVLHYRAEVRLGARHQRVIPPGFAEARGAEGELPFSRSYVKDAYFHVGAPFRIVDWIRYPSPRDAIASLRVPEPTGYFASVQWARFWLDPFVLDGCFQLAGTLGILYNLRAPVPKGVHRLVLGRTPRAGERLGVRARLNREVGELLFYDFTVWDEEGRICLEAHDYCSISVDAYTPEQKVYLRTSLDPAGGLHSSEPKVRAHVG
ncbi:C45 family autoproteolytic acyltransferase/hydrolase [Myxococcus sp. K38C18041901]|uniref:C45 family autoproteolytic acyltransferase/hydolase n=1 Tax=Myxococcus guangdongensis TaxID=2906760 RepID=UPI0020A77AD4|nr:C45 family autoproteolytic acyltransferase/hydolase [Myxococcus guangdongensis]MCP3061135.1 C45 family autoproteolytic acyltransferase/hydrolase [Myxococcus guangdongensis]